MITCTDIVFEPVNIDELPEYNDDWLLVGRYNLGWLANQLGKQPELDEGITCWQLEVRHNPGFPGEVKRIVELRHDEAEEYLMVRFPEGTPRETVAELGRYFAGAFSGGRWSN